MKGMRGFSLIETVIFIVVVGIALVGIVSLFVQNTQSSAHPLVRERTVAIAHACMDEVMGKRFDENTPVGGGCVETGSNSCTSHCAALTDSTCVQSKCRLQGPGNCVARAAVSGIATEEGSRSAYDDVDDYAGLSEYPAGVEGAATGYGGFNVLVTVSQPTAAWHGIDAQDLRHIGVDVTSPTNETIALEGYRVNF